MEEVPIDMTTLLDMQKQLMDKVPHGVKQEVFSDIICVRDILEKSLLFLNSLGHKPWRPNPLPPEVQQLRLGGLSHSLDILLMTHNKGFTPTLEGEEYNKYTRKLISVFGIIEEALEYMDCPDNKDSDRLEEITDILFFYLELVVMSGFSWRQIGEEYHRKHAVNLERYRKAAEGDYSWDKREGKL